MYRLAKGINATSPILRCVGCRYRRIEPVLNADAVQQYTEANIER
jgi:hypothetical protein